MTLPPIGSKPKISEIYFCCISSPSRFFGDPSVPKKHLLGCMEPMLTVFHYRKPRTVHLSKCSHGL